MDSLKNLLANKHLTKKPTNKLWLLSSEIAEVTNSNPKRWLRLCKTKFDFMYRKLAEFKEIIEQARSKQQKINCKISLFLWTLRR